MAGLIKFDPVNTPCECGTEGSAIGLSRDSATSCFGKVSSRNGLPNLVPVGRGRAFQDIFYQVHRTITAGHVGVEVKAHLRFDLFIEGLVPGLVGGSDIPVVLDEHILYGLYGNRPVERGIFRPGPYRPDSEGQVELLFHHLFAEKNVFRGVAGDDEHVGLGWLLA